MMAPRQVKGAKERARSDVLGSGSWNAVELTASANGSLRARCNEPPQPVSSGRTVADCVEQLLAVHSNWWLTASQRPGERLGSD